MNGQLSRSCLLLALVLFTCGCTSWASIEREPVKVDHRNAGPKYDIDDLERTRVLADNPESNQVMTAPVAPSRQDNERDDNSHQDAPMISIRRIFLVPMMSSPSASSGDDNERQNDPMRMFGMPPRSLFSPFSSSRHLFGGDEASRPAPINPDESRERPVMSSPGSASGGDDQETNERPRPGSALFDPIEMLMEAMRQALNPANMVPQPPTPDTTDLNKEASGDNKPAGGETGIESADKKPQSFNSTKEDIVEIDGKKYLRKTVINRHVGDGIMFMTKRLIFSPLNETETTEAPAMNNNNNKDSVTTSQPSTGSSTITPAASEPAASTETPTSSPNKEPSTTVATDKEETTKSIGEKVTDTMSKVERLMERIIERKQEPSTVVTDKPSS